MGVLFIIEVFQRSDLSVLLGQYLWFQSYGQSIPMIPVIWLVHTCHTNALIGQNPRCYSARKYQTIGVLIGMWFLCSQWSIVVLSALWLVHTCEPSALVGRAWFSCHRRPGTSPGARGRRAPRRNRAAGAPLHRTETIKKKVKMVEK